MKKLLLTSNEFKNPKIKEKFFEIINKDIEDIKILFIPTAASRTKKEKEYAKWSEEELRKMGIGKENLINFNLDRKMSEEELNSIDVIYVIGGNCFYLMLRLRESGFDKRIKNLVDKGIFYFGVSAGSVVAGKDISIASPYDENDVNLTDFTGMNLINETISPHYQNKEKKVIDRHERNLNLKITRLNDGQAILLLGNKRKVIE